MGNSPLKCQNYSLNHTASHHKRPASLGIVLFVVTEKEHVCGLFECHHRTRSLSEVKCICHLLSDTFSNLYNSRLIH